MDKNTPSPGFGGKTFDEWRSSLTEEEAEYLSRHILFGGVTWNGEKVAAWVRDDGMLVCGGGAAASEPLQMTLRGFKHHCLDILTDDEVESMSRNTRSWNAPYWQVKEA